MWKTSLIVFLGLMQLVIYPTIKGTDEIDTTKPAIVIDEEKRTGRKVRPNSDDTDESFIIKRRPPYHEYDDNYNVFNLRGNKQ